MNTKEVYALLDFDGKPIRYFDYKATGTVAIKVTYEQLIEMCGECLM